MPVEFIGMINAKDVSETRFVPGPPIDVDYTRRFIVAHEHAGFDQVLINSGSPQPDGPQIAAFGATHTERLGFLVSHRPGFIQPTLAARTLATLDQFAGGRIAIPIITGGSDAEMARDGDHLTKDERYERAGEWLEILRALWTGEVVDFAGKYVQIEGAQVPVGDAQWPEVYLGGSSPAALEVAARQADVYLTWG